MNMNFFLFLFIINTFSFQRYYMRRKKEKIYQIYGYKTILTKYKLNYDVINYISNFLGYKLVNIEKYLN